MICIETGCSGLDFALVIWWKMVSLAINPVWFDSKRNGLLWFESLIPPSDCSLNVRSTSGYTVVHRVANSHTESSKKISVNFDKNL